MEFKRQIFFRNENKELSQKDNYVFDIENFNPYNDKDVEYLDKLKEENEGEYYRILEKLVEKDVLKEELIDTEKLEIDNDYMNISDIEDFKEDAGEEYYGRFNPFKKSKNILKPQIKIDKKPVPYKKDQLGKIFYRDLLK